MVVETAVISYRSCLWAGDYFRLYKDVQSIVRPCTVNCTPMSNKDTIYIYIYIFVLYYYGLTFDGLTLGPNFFSFAFDVLTFDGLTMGLLLMGLL